MSINPADVSIRHTEMPLNSDLAAIRNLIIGKRSCISLLTQANHTANATAVFSTVYKRELAPNLVAHAGRAGFEVLIDSADEQHNGTSPPPQKYQALLVYRCLQDVPGQPPYRVVAQSLVCEKVQEVMCGLLRVLAKVMEPSRHYQPMAEPLLLGEGAVDQTLL